MQTYNNSKVSILIPSRDEPWLLNTVNDLLAKAEGDIEILAVIDGPTSHPLPEETSKVKLISLSEPMGMRYGINLAASMATGKYLMKLDSHCMMTESYDTIFQKDCDDDWVIVSRRGELNPDWEITDPTIADYFYMSNPWTSPQGYMRMSRWITRDREHKDILIDETQTFSGSNWFMSKEHFFERMKMMDEDRFGQWSGEPEELACKTWLSGGRVMINKNITHFHLRKEKIGRPYHIGWNEAVKGLQESARYWSSDEWPYRIHNFDWIIEHFWPLPSKAHHCHAEKYFWEDDWKKDYHA
jgi:glycosyltransferase involved in cell wall biosynthesis